MSDDHWLMGQAKRAADKQRGFKRGSNAIRRAALLECAEIAEAEAARLNAERLHILVVGAPKPGDDVSALAARYRRMAEEGCGTVAPGQSLERERPFDSNG